MVVLMRDDTRTVLSMARKAFLFYRQADAPDVPEGFVEALRAGAALSDVRLEALRLFVRDLVRNRGRVADVRWEALEAAGFTEAQALDAVLGTGVYLLSTLTNVVTRAEIDQPFQPFRWTRAE